MARKHPDRPLYVTQPRDLDKHPDFAAMSLPAQWLLQHLERDPYRLSCGVFVFNPTVVARAAHATVDDVQTWFAEVREHGWAEHDEDTAEVWLTAHMGWDFTLSSPNGAKGVLRDLKRVHSERLVSAIERVVYARFPSLDPSELDPGRDDPEGASGDVPEGASGEVSGTPEPKQVPQARSTKPEAHPRSTEPEAHGPSPKPEAQRGAPCEKCADTGLCHDERGATAICTCRAGRGLAGSSTLRVVS